MTASKSSGTAALTTMSFERARSKPGSTTSYGSSLFPMHAREVPAAAGRRHPVPTLGIGTWRRLRRARR